METTLENPTKGQKMYSVLAISGATFLGGPLAAGYMMRENFKAINEPDKGKTALILGILGALALMAIVFIPDDIMESIPRQLIPLTYTGLVYYLSERNFAEILKNHKAVGNKLFSGWRAAGIGFVSLLILTAGITAYVFFGMDYEVYDQYDDQIALFSKNEDETLVFYGNLDTKTDLMLLHELNKTHIPKWEENIEIIKEVSKLEGLPSDLDQQNVILLRYAELRLEAFQLFKKSIEEQTDKYDPDLTAVHEKIDEQLDLLNSL